MNRLTLEGYVAGRQNLLERIAAELSQDQRFAAGWLAGSFGRGEQDAMSDLDLTVIVRDAFYPVLCLRPHLVSARTTPERWTLFSQFGQPAILHENNHNAPKNGTFTFVMYAESMVGVDWILRPQQDVIRPAATFLLWDHVGIPQENQNEQSSLAQRVEEADEMIAFFYMMSVIVLKYIYRSDWDFTKTWFTKLDKLIHEVGNRIHGMTRSYRIDSYQNVPPSRLEQIQALKGLLQEMSALVPQVHSMGGKVLPTPTNTLQNLLNLVSQAG